MQTKIKICGIHKEKNIECCVENSIDMIGFVFYQKSHRNITIENAKNLYQEFGQQINIVGLVVDPDDSLIETIVNDIGIKTIQFHGNEDLDKLLTLKSKFDIQIIKAINIDKNIYKNELIEFQENLDYLLLDAPVPESSSRPGGNGHLFDWGLTKHLKLKNNWILSGGLRPDNVVEAIKVTGAEFIDVSSGVEDSDGCKDNDLITKFIYNARSHTEKN